MPRGKNTKLQKAMENSNCLLNGKSISLRRWESSDAGWYVNSRDDEILKWTSEKRNLTIQETIEAIEKVNQMSDIESFAIVENTSGSLMGNIVLVLGEPDKSEAELMYWLAPQARGRGFATESVNLIIDWAVQQLKVERFIAKVYRRNNKSTNVLTRLVPYQPNPCTKNKDLV